MPWIASTEGSLNELAMRKLEERLETIPSPCTQALTTGDLKENGYALGTSKEVAEVWEWPGQKSETILQNFSEDDARYLRAKGAFTEPIARIKKALVQAFVNSVQHDFPVLDMLEFATLLSSDGVSEDRASPILLQAVLFVGSSHVDSHVIQDAGFESREEIRRTFYDRAKVSG